MYMHARIVADWDCGDINFKLIFQDTLASLNETKKCNTLKCPNEWNGRKLGNTANKSSEITPKI